MLSNKVLGGIKGIGIAQSIDYHVDFEVAEISLAGGGECL
jgi:hypothetical protein